MPGGLYKEVTDMKQHEADKPYDPGKDPYFLEAEHIIPADVFGVGRLVVFAVLALAILAYKLFGWLGLVIVAAAGAALYAAWRLVKKSRVAAVTAEGWTNRHNQVVCECITPREKKFDEKFYRLECRDCGKSQNVQATRIRGAKCPHCRDKK